MDIVYLLVGIGLVFALAIGWTFLRAVDGGQFENLEQAGEDIFTPAEARSREAP